MDKHGSALSKIFRTSIFRTSRNFHGVAYEGAPRFHGLDGFQDGSSIFSLLEFFRGGVGTRKRETCGVCFRHKPE